MENLSKYNAALILGGGVYESKRRASYATKILNGYDIPIIVSGGVPKTIPLIQNPHGRPEAEIMEQILKEKRVKSKIYKETKAQSTLENFVKSKTIIEKINGKNIMLIDGIAHLKRSLKIAKEILPDHNFTGFTVPIFYQNIMANILVEGISGTLELISKDNGKYRFYNNY